MQQYRCLSAAEALHDLTDSVVGIARNRGCNEMSANSLRLVLEELLTNIQQHAYGGKPGPVELDVCPPAAAPRRACEEITLALRDQGPKFNPLTDTPGPDLGRDVETRRIGGLGVHFVQSLASFLAYRRLERDGKPDMNELTITIKLECK